MALQASLMLLSLALAAALSSVQAQSAQGQALATPPEAPAFIRRNGLIHGNVVILSVWSLLPSAPLPLSETNCAAACARTPGCNAYAYCPDNDGLGSGCLGYTREHPQLLAQDMPTSSTTYNMPAWANLTTIDRFGPWGSTAYCGVSGKPRRADRWPHNMCTLKKIILGVGNRAPVFEQDGSVGDNWRSGYLPTSSFLCGPLPLTTCYKCISSREMKACLRCANVVSPRLSLLAKVAGPTRMDSCNGDVSSLQAVTCLEQNATCAQCVTWKDQSRTAYNSSRCIECLHEMAGQAFLPACQYCANLGDPALVDQCMACLKAMKPHACNATRTKDCWSPTLHAQSCAKCATANATTNQQCVACMQATPVSLLCDACSALNATDTQKALCYSCNVNTSAMGCARCFKGDSVQQQQCISCMVDPSLSNVTGRLFCADCAKSCATTEEYRQCIQRCNTLPYNTSHACVCQKKVANNTLGSTTVQPPSTVGSGIERLWLRVFGYPRPRAGDSASTTHGTDTSRNSSSPDALAPPQPLTKTTSRVINTTMPSHVDSAASVDASTNTNATADASPNAPASPTAESPSMVFNAPVPAATNTSLATPTPLDSNITSFDVVVPAANTTIDSIVAKGTTVVGESSSPDANGTAPALLS